MKNHPEQSPLCDSQHSVYSGEDALKHFLDPSLAPASPLVELPGALNPFLDQNVRIFVKLMNLLPLGNIKAVSAHNMVMNGLTHFPERVPKQLIEYSSGNTIFSAALIARAYGVSQSHALVSHEVPWSKIQLLRLFGIEVTVHYEPSEPVRHDPTSGVSRAKQMAEASEDALWLGQYENEANPEAHQRITGPQIWEQTQGNISLFCMGFGTSGTILGTTRYLKSQSEKIQTIGVVRKGTIPVPGVTSRSKLEQLIDLDWKSSVDTIYEIEAKEAYRESLELCRRGLLVGPSTGFAYAGLKHVLKEKQRQGSLDACRNAHGEVIAVFIGCDGPLPYLHEYVEYVDEAFLAPIHHAQLIKDCPADHCHYEPSSTAP